MPILIDGYNLYHYARSVYAEDGTDLSLSAFVSLLDEWTRRGRQKVKIIFDGAVPPVLRQNPSRYGSLDLEFSGGGSDADTLIEVQVHLYSAPKFLTVVSSDRRIRKAAERRRCKVKTSDEFWLMIAKKLTSKPPLPDPREKTGGLFSHEVEYWLKVFGMK
jgi:predicted RNA-binding protein with PIN domain